MHAALFSGIKKLRIIDFNPGDPGEKEIIIKVGACGVCGTDFHIFHGDSHAKIPVVIGHEFAGEVVYVGSGVNNLKPGDLVAVDPNIPCYECEFCRSGRIHLCINLRALGVTMNGGFSSFAKVPVSQAYILPRGFSLDTAAFSEPLSCCIHGLDQACIQMDDTVTIIGAGNIGLLMLQLVNLRGPKKILVYEKAPDKRELARHLGADLALDPSGPLSGLSDVVIECAGTQESAELALKTVKRGGRVIIFGLAPPAAEININLQTLFSNEITIKSSLLNPFTFQKAVDLLVSGKVKVDDFRISKVSLSQEKIDKLFSEPRDSSVIKYMLVPN